MDTAQFAISVLAVGISVLSFIIAQRSAARARRFETISQLLGKKETVAFASLKLLREGLPEKPGERALVLSALLQICIFEGSDRARALLFRVVELNRGKYGPEILAAIQPIEDAFSSMDRYEFKKDELDLEKGKNRITYIKRIIATP